MTKPEPTCRQCGQPPRKVQGTELLMDGLCWFCRMKIRMAQAQK